MSTLVKDIASLAFPPFCVHCEKLLHFRDNSALCPECKALWDYERAGVCKSCFRPVELCDCVPRRAGKNIRRCFHVAEYDKSVESVARSIVLSCKDNRYTDVYELAINSLEDCLKTHMKSFKNTVITYVPRKRSKVMKTGVDQARIVAEELAQRLGIECVCAIKRHGGSEQKHLDSEQRLENAKKVYSPLNDALISVNSRTVILYDDIVTTGSSATACADVLKGMGARSVYLLCLGRTYPKGKKTGFVGEK